MTAVDEVVPAFAGVFPFEAFNRMQSAVLPALLDREDNVVVSAPTASGKTGLAEVAICRTLAAGGTALFLAPLRALTAEKEREWERFEEAGYSVYVVTGDRDLNPRRARRADILVMTPEKADSATRNQAASRYSFVRTVDCCVIDEVHLLDSTRRGPVLEATVARLRRLCSPRVVALSAEMPNVEDVASWLDAPPACTFSFDESYRPVPLEAAVETYTHGENAFADKYRRLYRALDLAQPHLAAGGQALVFVASRRDTVKAASKAREVLADRDLDLGVRGDFDRHTQADELANDTLSRVILDGVAFHHAGLARRDRTVVERWFRAGRIGVLFSTSTLAWGVNLPARCVVVRDTKLHDPLAGEVEVSPLDLRQMIGRAGRPGFDDAGHAYVISDADEAERYRRLLEHGTEIESRLAEDLDGHLNAEIALGSVGDVDDAVDWLSRTFYAVRAGHDPHRYEADGDLRRQARDAIRRLADGGFVRIADGRVESTTVGRLTSGFYLELGTAKRLRHLATDVAGPVTDGTGSRSVEEGDLLVAVARADEFDSVTARRDEADAIRTVVPDGDDLEPGTRKVLAVLRASMDGTTPAELRSDAWAIQRNALRLLAAAGAFLDRLADGHAANRARRIAARVETGVGAPAVGLTAIEGVGARRAGRLATAGLTDPAAVRDAGTEGLVEAGLSGAAAERVLDRAGELPDLSVDWGAFPDTIAPEERELHEVTIDNQGGGARAAIRATANGREMTSKEVYLGESTIPVVAFGGDVGAVEITVSVAFPELPLAPAEWSRTVTVT